MEGTIAHDPAWWAEQNKLINESPDWIEETDGLKHRELAKKTVQEILDKLDIAWALPPEVVSAIDKTWSVPPPVYEELAVFVLRKFRTSVVMDEIVTLIARRLVEEFSYQRARSLLERLGREGIRISLDGERIMVGPRGKVTTEISKALRRNKATLLRILK